MMFPGAKHAGVRLQRRPRNARIARNQGERGERRSPLDRLRNVLARLFEKADEPAKVMDIWKTDLLPNQQQP
jgi:hypothetical protein